MPFTQNKRPQEISSEHKESFKVEVFCVMTACSVVV